MAFKDDILARDTNLYPVVVINNDDIFISTNSTTIGGNYYKPLLLNVPSLKESIDIEKRNYRISNVTLDISNYKHDGERFSDTVGNTSLINQTVDIYWISPSVTTLDDAYKAYSGWVLRYEMSDEKVKLTVEDRSQAKLHKDLPLERHYLSGDTILDKYKNKPKPMVYGIVDKSPCVVGGITLFGDNQIGSPDIDIIIDSDESVVATGENPLFAYKDNYIKMLKSHPTLSMGSSPQEVGDLTLHKESDQYRLESNKIVLLPTYESGETTEQVPSNTISNNSIIGYEEVKPLRFTPIRNVEHNLPTGFGTPSMVKYYSTHPTIDNINGYELGKKISATVLDEDRVNDWDGKSVLTDGGDELWGTVNPGDDAKTEEGVFGLTMTMPVLGASSYASHVSIIRTHFKLYWDNMTIWDDLTNNNEQRLRIDWSHTGKNETFNQHGIIYSEIYIHEADGSGEIIVYDNTGTEVATSQDGEAGIGVAGDQLIYYPEELLLWVKIGGFHGSLGVYADIYKLWLDHYMLIDDMMGLDFYADVKGRLAVNSTSPKAPDLIEDIMVNELGQEVTLPTEYHYDWKYAFTIHEKINSKKLIENIASASPYLPRFNNKGEFVFDVIKPTYTFDNLNDDATLIEEADCISWSFTRTDIEQVYTKVVLKYNWDYGLEDFSSTYPEETNELLVEGLVGAYEYDYYGLTDDTDSTLTIDDDRGKYIRVHSTAEKFAEWLLYWHCNQHLKIKLKLPLKYIEIEVGSLISFDKILGDVKPFGINYAKDADYIDEDENYLFGDVANGQQIFPLFLCTSTSKSLTDITVECIQMHNLSDNLVPGDSSLIGVMDDTAWNYNSNAIYPGGTPIFASTFVMEGCPVQYHPYNSYNDDLAGDPFTFDYSENWVEGMTIDGNPDNGIFVAQNINDPMFDKNGVVYDYWDAGGTPQIYLLDNCDWEDTIEHKIDWIKINIISESGNTTELAVLYGDDLPALTGETYIIDWDVLITEFMLAELAEHDGLLNLKFEYKFKENSPTFEGNGKFYRHYFAAIDGGQFLTLEDANIDLTQTFEEVVYTNALKNTYESEIYEEDYNDPGNGHLMIPVTVFIPSVVIDGIGGILDNTEWMEINRLLKVTFTLPQSDAPLLLGDINGDTEVDVLDIVMLESIIRNESYNDWGANDPLHRICDINGDGEIDILDLISLNTAVLNETDLGYV